MSQDQQHRRAERARQGSRRQRDRAALAAEGGAMDYDDERFTQLRELGRELFPEATEEWWPIAGVAIRRFRRDEQEVSRKAIALHLVEQGYPGAASELLPEGSR